MKKLFFLTITIFLLLVGCQKEDGVRAPQSKVIGFGSKAGGISMEWESGQGISRADDDIPADQLEDFGVFAYYNKSTAPEVFINQQVLYYHSAEYTAHPFKWDYWDGNTGLSAWPYTITPGSTQKNWNKQKYRFLAYSPWRTEGVSVSATDYNFNTFTLANIPEYSDHDYLVSKSIVAVDNSAGGRTTADLVTFEMQHLMARIRFIFKMSDHYRNIRRIVINSVSVQSDNGKQNTATVTYKPDNTIDEITWNSVAGAMPTSITLIKEYEEDYDVTTDFAGAPSFGSVYIMPQSGFNELTMTVNYSTYDSSGKKTRDAEVSNRVRLAEARDLLGGKYYDLKISIVPAYLYVLSDNDQDFDGWVIVKEP